MLDRKPMRLPVVVTGATGFVGGHLVDTLRMAGLDVRPCAREPLGQIDSRDSGTWDFLRGSAAVVHLAARAHVLEEHSNSAIAVYRQVNRDLTLKLAQAAVAAGVSRFVFLSSIRVNGSSSSRPFRPEDAPRPEEPYAISKYEAELALWKIAQDSGLEVVIIRPPLVYGPGVKANFRRLLKLAASGLPLPLASVVSLRSLLSVHNLCNLLHVCLDHPAASGKTLLVSDGEDIALPALIRELAAGMGRRARLFPVPARILRMLAACAGKGTTFDKLTASLQVDASETFAALGWRPPLPLRDGLRETARWFAESPR